MVDKKESYLNTQSELSMKGAGYYSRKTIGAKIAIDSSQNLIIDAVSKISKSNFLRFADFGSADGGTSQELWYNLIKSIRAGGDQRPIEIIYTDLASNDFSTLFRTMQGMGENANLAYQEEFENVYVHACGTGFHRQLVTSGTLSLGFSATAMHYVSEKPCQILDHVHMVGASKLEREKFKRQALKDWEAILCARANELEPGGRFICINFGIDENGRYLGNTGGNSMFESFHRHWRQHLENGIITKEEFVSATFPQHYRTIEEFSRPFLGHNCLANEIGLRLNKCFTKLTKCPYQQQFEDNKKTFTPTKFAKEFIPTIRSWSETVFRSALKGRTRQQTDHIIETFYKNYENEVARNPSAHSMDYVHIVMEIERI
tara:strand:+ start:422 stop:1543 length:1122 start_codon:yes stop_codon:yes gene_type:complete